MDKIYNIFSNLKIKSDSKVKSKTKMYDDVLENCVFFHKELSKTDKLLKKVRSYFEPDEKIYISLSGGVDSMVLLAILKDYCRTTALHINYVNRSESEKEEEFLKLWCEHYDVECRSMRMPFRRDNENISRNVYERDTNRLRYQFYRENIGSNFVSNSVLLGHHKNDVVENVFANMMNNKPLFDLHNMKFESMINDVIIKRPLIEFYKKDIMKFAKEYDIPYFKDTTPGWSVRGRLRNSVLKSVIEVYPNYENALYNAGVASNEWKQITNEMIIGPLLDKVKIRGNMKFLSFEFDHGVFIDKPFVLFREFCVRLMHDNDLSMFSNKATREMYNKLESKEMLYNVGRDVKIEMKESNMMIKVDKNVCK